MGDCLRAGFCPKGVRAWLEVRGLNYREFVRNGLPEEEWIAVSDGLGDVVLAKARERLDG